MTPFEIGIASVVCIVVMIYAGLYIPVALGLVSFLGVWIIRDNIDIAINMLALAAADTVSHQVFATVPLFAMMGLIVSKAGLGNDVYKVANFIFYKVRGGLGIATVAANAVFAAITGSSIASASVFARVSVPEMRKFGYTTRFSVGVVAGSSVLGHDHPAKCDADHLRDHGGSIGGAAIPRRDHSGCSAGCRLCPGDRDHGTLLAEICRRAWYR